MKEKEVYKRCIVVLKELELKKTISLSELRNIAGIYYISVKDELIHQNAAYNIGFGDIAIDDNAITLIETEYYKRKLKDIEYEEYRIELDNKSKIASIKATKIAKWALWLSIISLTGLIQRLIEWLLQIIL